MNARLAIRIGRPFVKNKFFAAFLGKRFFKNMGIRSKNASTFSSKLRKIKFAV